MNLPVYEALWISEGLLYYQLTQHNPSSSSCSTCTVCTIYKLPLLLHCCIHSVMVAFGQHLWQQSTDFIYQVLSAQRSSFMGSYKTIFITIMYWTLHTNTHCTTGYDVIGGIIHAEMLGRTNLLALIAGGTTPKFPDRNGMYIGIYITLVKVST